MPVRTNVGPPDPLPDAALADLRSRRRAPKGPPGGQSPSRRFPSLEPRARLANTLALGLGSLLALGLGEVGLRLFAPQPTGPVWFAYDPELGAIPTPGEHGERTLPGIYRFSFTHDAQGLRADPAAASASPRHAVLVLGDS